MNISRIGGLAAVALMSAALLAGCGSSSDSAASGDTVANTSTTGMVGGMTTCDAAAIGTAVENTSTSGAPAVLAEPDSFGCADGWAYAYANVGEGEGQVTETLVFQAEGQFWVPKDRATVCTAPGNEVPAAIYKDACETN